MSNFTKQNFLEPFTILLRQGTEEDPYKNITETIRLVPAINMEAAVYNIAVLREIPLLSQGVTAIVDGSIELTEIRDSLTEIDDTNFKVDYTNGRVYLSKNYAGSEVTFGYKGRGAILVNGERILLSYGGPGLENIYTLDQYVQEHMGEANIGQLANLKTTAKDKVVNAINEIYDSINNHIQSTGNVHNMLKSDIGLGNVDNTSDMDKPLSNLQKTYIDNQDNDIRLDFTTADSELQQQIEALQGAYIYIGTISLNTADVTQSALNSRAQSLMGTTTLQTGWVLIDNEKHDWYYNGTTAEWIDLDTSNIYNATNSTYGLVKGNDKVSIVDGLMTVTLAENSSKLGGQLPSYYGTAADVANKVSKSGDTMSGKLNFVASTTNDASINIPHGTAPTTPTDGDIWTTTTSIMARINGNTRTFYHNGNASTAALTTVSQGDAEAGTSTTVRAWTAQRVRQAIDARAWTNETLVIGTVEPSPITGKTILWIDMN